MTILYEGFGNVLTHKSQTITVPVNCMGVMGRGLALSFRNRVQGLNDRYKEMCEVGSLSIGRLNIYQDPDPQHPRQILLFPTKEHFKNPSQMEFIEKGLQDLVSRYQDLGIEELALPALGCGLGKLDYVKNVRPMMVDYLNQIDIPVYILLRS